MDEKQWGVDRKAQPSKIRIGIIIKAVARYKKVVGGVVFVVGIRREQFMVVDGGVDGGEIGLLGCEA